jgi:hypothetical protein
MNQDTYDAIMLVAIVVIGYNLGHVAYILLEDKVRAWFNRR